MSSTRRQFFQTTAAALSAVRALAARPDTADADSRIEVLLNEPLGTVAPECYSHFVEHLGGCVYDGIWVGENSRVPNTGGVRKALTDALSKVKPGVIRWPGGCYADQYDWRDGIGPREKRPKRTNFWVDSPEWPREARRDGPQVYETNQVGTIEFARFCKLAGAQPYFAANLRSLPAQEFWRWVEYCNSPAGSTTLASQRASDGEREPLGVRFWGVGNESWGCGGNFTPEDYATEFRRYTAWVPGYGMHLSLVGSGPNGDDYQWTRRFIEKVAEGRALDRLWGWALHHYAWNVTGGRIQDWLKGKGDALRFDAEQHYNLLHEANRMEGLITGHWAVMGEYDREHRVKLVVDEWGAWYLPGTEPFSEALLGQQNTLRDAVLAALTLDTFNRHPEKVAMANVAQLVNCLQSLFLAHEDRFCLTPTYHVFDMYSAHQGAQAVRTVFSAPEITWTTNGRQSNLPGMTGSASRTGNQLTLTFSNPSLDQNRETEIALRGGRAVSAKATLLTAKDAHAHNTFDAPRTVEPATQDLTLRGGQIAYRIPPASVVKLTIQLG